VNCTEEKWTRTWDELLGRIMDAMASIKNVKINSDEQHATFSHELQSALMLMVEFSKMYYKLINLSLEQ
jgi:hypothetical protein